MSVEKAAEFANAAHWSLAYYQDWQEHSVKATRSGSLASLHPLVKGMSFGSSRIFERPPWPWGEVSVLGCCLGCSGSVAFLSASSQFRTSVTSSWATVLNLKCPVER